MASVTLQGVAKTYPGGAEAVAGFSLEIGDGEFVVLVGPSGCGKSTILRIIAGLEEASAGSVSIGGRVVNGVHPKDRDIAMVFQNYALYPHMSVYQNMAFALKLRGVARGEIERRVHDAARTLGIEPLLSRRPRELSGGQRQRVAVGRAIVREPKAFLFDEPLSNLDAALRLSTRAELKALHQRLRTTTVYVTHDQEEAMTLGDRIVVMDRGRIQQAGPPLEVYTRPVNRFVAGFVGTPAMNMIDGRLERDGSELVFVERGEPGGRATIRLGGAAAGRLASHAGRDVVLGARPQALTEPSPGAEAGGRALTVHVQVVEPLGDLMDVLGRTAAGARVVARLPARVGMAPGAAVDLLIDVAKVHCFEPGAAGANLLGA